MSSESIRVLCIDDNQLLLTAMQRRMELEPDIVWRGQACVPDELVHRAREFQPDVILLDVDMPDVDAFSLVRELSAAVPDARTVMFSGHVRPSYIELAVDAGAWGYLSKNEPIDLVTAAIRRVVAGEFVVTPEVDAVQRTAQGEA